MVRGILKWAKRMKNKVKKRMIVIIWMLSSEKWLSMKISIPLWK